MKAKNKYMGNQFDPIKESHYLQYLDANNLYGSAMSQPLPTGRFTWVSNPENLKGRTSKLAKKQSKDYFLEVNVCYLQNLHNLNNDFPFMCEKRKINGVQKLVPNLYNKKIYVMHIMALNQVFKHELILKQIHQVVEFDQSAWSAPYINFNTQLRTKVKNNFEKDFFKLMNNSVFGKTMENIRKHKDINLLTNEEAYLERVMKPNFMSGVQFRS